MSEPIYEVRVIGTLGPAGRCSFADMTLEVQPTTTVMSGELSRAGLHDLLERVQSLGLELVDVRQMPSAPQAD